ncbi:hypothetical protein D3C85_1756010 [compost metagenome]
MLRLQVEQRQHLVQHFTMLPGHADDILDQRFVLQRSNQRRHFDGFRARPEDG